jgi:hypothetical protein
MTSSTVQPEPDGRDPEQTDRYPDVQAIVDEFVSPAAVTKETPVDEDETRAVVAEHFRCNPLAEQDTDAGFVRLAGLLGLNRDSAAVA